MKLIGGFLIIIGIIVITTGVATLNMVKYHNSKVDAYRMGIEKYHYGEYKEQTLGHILVGCGVAMSIAGIVFVAIPQVKRKICPYCAEKILIEAKVCRYCGRELKKEENEKETTEISQ